MNQCDLPIGENCPFFCGHTYVYMDNESTKPICDNALVCRRAINETKDEELLQVLRELERKRMEERKRKVDVKLDKGAYMPTRAHDLDAGYDIRTPYEFDVNAMDHLTIYTGVHIAIPKGYVGMLKSKSGLNINYSVLGEGVIDAGYTGQIVAKLYNHGVIPVHFARGDKIIQLVLLPIFTPDLQQVDDLSPTERGDDGFGSTGR